MSKEGEGKPKQWGTSELFTQSQSSCLSFKGEGSSFPAGDKSRILTTTSSDVEVGIRYFHYFGQNATYTMLIFSLGLQLLAFPCCSIAV